VVGGGEMVMHSFVIIVIIILNIINILFVVFLRNAKFRSCNDMERNSLPCLVFMGDTYNIEKGGRRKRRRGRK